MARAHEPKAYSAGLARGLGLPVGLVAVALFLWWETGDGGYAPTAWYPAAAVFLVLLGAVLTLGAARSGIPGNWPTRALLFFAVFTVWSFLSIVWAGVQGDAWDGANRTLLYLTVYATFVLLSWRARDAGVLLGLFAIGTASIGAAALATEGASAFIDGRLASPTGYANASAGLFLAAFWPAASLAARPEVHWAARGVLLAASGVLVQLAVLAQSRGSVVAGAVAFAVYVLLSKRRLRSVLVLVPVAAVTLASLDALLSVFASSTESGFREAVAQEQVALALSAVVLLAWGVVMGRFDRPGAIGRRRRLQLGRRSAVLAAGAVLAALAAAVVAAGLWTGAGGGQGSSPTSALESSRFDGLETGRFDMWRVAAETVVDRPLLGAGADNFAVDFARERRTYEEPLYPHSVVLRAFSQTGLVGGALFVGFVAAALLAAVRVARRSAGLANAVAAASIASAVYWLVHSSLDWFWEIPVLAAPALALLALASRLEQPSFDRPLSRRLRSLRVRSITAVLGAAALGSYAFPGLAAAALERAVAAWPTAPEQTFADLDRARRLNPLSDRADVVAGTLLQRAGQPAKARIAFERALDRNPQDWYAHLRLALLDAAAGERSEARAGLSRAEVLNPLEPAIQAAAGGLFDSGRRRQLIVRLDQLAVQGPLGRRPVVCRPILGIAGSCTAGGSS